MSSLYGFSMKHIKKSSITKCHGLSLRHHFIWIFHANANKKLATKMPWIKPPISCLYGFVHANANKSSIPKCHEFSIRCHVHMDFSMKMSKKARYQNFTNSAPDVIFNMDLSQKKCKKKCSVPKCHELSIRCHVFIVCDEKNSFHKTSSSRRTHKVRTILIQPKSKQISCKSLNATNSKMKRSIYSRRSHTPDSQS